MKLRIVALASIAASFVASTAFAGTLTNASVTLSTSAVSTPTTVTTAFTIETEFGVGNNETIIVNFPGLSLSNGDCTNGEVLVSIDGTEVGGTFSSCALFSDTALAVSLPGSLTVPAGSTIVVTIPSTRASTGPTAGSYSALLRTENTQSGASIDTAAPAPSYSFGSAPTSVPTMTEWAMILFGTILAGGAALYIQRRQLIA